MVLPDVGGVELWVIAYSYPVEEAAAFQFSVTPVGVIPVAARPVGAVHAEDWLVNGSVVHADEVVLLHWVRTCR